MICFHDWEYYEYQNVRVFRVCKKCGRAQYKDKYLKDKWVPVTSDIEYEMLAEAVMSSSTCLVAKFGCIIVNEKGRVIGVGSNRVPEGEVPCNVLGKCSREVIWKDNKRFTRGCKCIHAEVHAVLEALKKQKDLSNCTLYLAGEPSHARAPCEECSKVLRQVNIKRVKWWSTC